MSITHVHTYMYTLNMHVHVHVCVQLYTCTCMCDFQVYQQCVYMCVCVCTYMHACVCVCVHVCMWIILSCVTCTDSLTSGSRPDLSELVQFRGRKRAINIPREVGHRYERFGRELLGGHMGRVWRIMYVYREKPEHINLHTLLEWLEGEGRRPATWRTLVQTLENIGLDELAREIQDALTTAGTADEPPPTPAPGMMSMCCVGTCVSIGCIGCVHVLCWYMYTVHVS